MQSNREWIERVRRHEDGPVPYNFMFSPPAQRRVQAHYGADLEAALGLPLRMTGCQSIKPLYADPQVFGPTVRDEYGVLWTTNPIDRGSPIGPCLREASLAGYRFPDPERAERFAAIPAWCRQQAGHYRVVWVGDLWERATFMRGMGELLLDVATAPAFVEALLDGITAYVLATMRRLFACGEFEAIAVSDDYGTQRAMVISPAMWRRLVRPRLAQVYALAQAHGRAVFHHTCGHVLPIIGDLVDLGLDFLHPLQPEAMDPRVVKREFGAHLTLVGGISTQQLLVHSSPAAVRAEVRRLQRELGRGGGYILEPGITLQDDVPVANMVAMIDAARGRGQGQRRKTKQ